MDIFFQDPSDVPLPPDEVRIRQFRAEPWPDQRRVRVFLEITPFQKRPHGEIKIVDGSGEEVATLTIIEALDPKMDFTMHLRGAEPGGRFTASAIVYYYEPEEQDPGGEDGEAEKPAAQLPGRVVIVDSAETKFETVTSDKID